MAITLKPGQQRRILAEVLVLDKYPNFRDCAKACQKYADDNDIDVTFNILSVQHYVGCELNFSTKRLKILAKLLGVEDYATLDEIFVAPLERGHGKVWKGDNGTTITDIDMTEALSKIK